MEGDDDLEILTFASADNLEDQSTVIMQSQKQEAMLKQYAQKLIEENKATQPNTRARQLIGKVLHFYDQEETSDTAQKFPVLEDDGFLRETKNQKKFLVLRDYTEIIKDKKRVGQYPMNLKRFNILFPIKKPERRNSSSVIFQNLIDRRKKDFQRAITKKATTKQRKTEKDLRIEDTIKFFKFLMKKVSRTEQKLVVVQKIFRHLQYDSIDRKLELARSRFGYSGEGAEFSEFPRRLEPWG